jgi:hypothetical protein
MGAHPAVLVVHDGELPELGRVLVGLGVEVHERIGTATPAERARNWDLVLGTPSRLIELDEGPGQAACRIAALCADTRTARAILARSGVRLVVRLPVHPAALRLLVLHSLYRGPERRRQPRVGIGAAVRIRSGLRRRPALLVDLSLRGCRLLVANPPPRGRRLSLSVPGSVAGGRPLALVAVVARVLEPDARMPGVTALVALFQGVSERDSRRLAEIVASHASGPATCDPGSEAPLVDPREWPSAPPVAARPEAAAPDPAEEATAEIQQGEPRAAPASPPADLVLALGLEAARVLIGRDLSAGGMRIDPHPDLGEGDELRLALHLGVQPEPVVVRARVLRDEGERGLALAFHDLGAGERRELERTLSLLPMIEMPDSGEELGGLVVSEILGDRGIAAAI